MEGNTNDGVADRVHAGQKVYDADGVLVGTVNAIDRQAGTIRVATNPFSNQEMDVPLALIRWLDARELLLACRRDALAQVGIESFAGSIDLTLLLQSTPTVRSRRQKRRR